MLLTKINPFLKRMISLLQPWQKTAIVIATDIAIATFALYGSFFIKMGDLSFPAFELKSFHITLILMITLQAISFYKMGLYKGIWRYSSTQDLIRLIKGATLAVVFSFIGSFFYNRLNNISRSVFFIDWLLLIISLGGTRFAYRIWRDHNAKTNNNHRTDKIIIVGAGDGGEKLYREIQHSPTFDSSVVAFIDDDLGKRNKSIHGIQIMGGISDIAQVVKKTSANKIFIAIPSATNKEFRRIIKECENTKLEIKTLPSLKDILQESEKLTELRDVKPEDLLGRDEIKLDRKNLGLMIKDKVVLVTGAGGSIGSELCRQIALFKPKTLVLFEISEYFLYELEMQLNELFPELNIISTIGDVRSSQSVENIFNKTNPSIVFHAAAYKHVPMMEKNPLEAVNTNIIGTKTVCESSLKYNVDRFVLISTDKAVNPTNIMGATKRIAEMTTQRSQDKSKHTKFMVVRFGNVLGSSGSVIPLFKKQIKKGGPITVTHPEITRYFMSIPEASQLVMQAGSIGSGGEIFVLDMGEPFKITHLAKQLITLAGLRVNEDIEIKFTGLRAGEKLYEELLADQESTLTTCHPKVKIAKAREVSKETNKLINELVQLPPNTEVRTIIERLQNIVPEYTPDNRFKV